jgi:hypothetical protein
MKHYAFVDKDRRVVSVCSRTSEKPPSPFGGLEVIAVSAADAEMVRSLRVGGGLAAFGTVKTAPGLEAGAQIEVRKEADVAPLWNALRSERNRRLAATDWTQLPDAPLTPDQRTACAAYRQALRDLPQNTADPANPCWPPRPSSGAL